MRRYGYGFILRQEIDRWIRSIKFLQARYVQKGFAETCALGQKKYGHVWRIVICLNGRSFNHQ